MKPSMYIYKIVIGDIQNRKTDIYIIALGYKHPGTLRLWTWTYD